jgi:hypothetical protein
MVGCGIANLIEQESLRAIGGLIGINQQQKNSSDLAQFTNVKYSDARETSRALTSRERPYRRSAPSFGKNRQRQRITPRTPLLATFTTSSHLLTHFTAPVSPTTGFPQRISTRLLLGFRGSILAPTLLHSTNEGDHGRLEAVNPDLHKKIPAPAPKSSRRGN